MHTHYGEIGYIRFGPLSTVLIVSEIGVFKTYIVIEYHKSILHIFKYYYCFFPLIPYQIGCTKMFSSVSMLSMCVICYNYRISIPTNKNFNTSLCLQFLIPFYVYKNKVKDYRHLFVENFEELNSNIKG